MFVGSGISRQAQNISPNDFPNWNELLRGLNDLYESSSRHTPAEINEIDDLIARGEFLMAAQQLYEHIPKQRYEEFLKKKFSPINSMPGVLHDAIVRLNSPFIITTNYDSLLEVALRKICNGVDDLVFLGSRSDLLLDKYKNAKHSKYPFVLKIHGTISDLDTMVLTHDSYVDLYNRREFQDLLASIFLNYTVLMIGFSLSDPEMLHFLGALHARFNRRLPRSFLFASGVGETSVKAQRLEEDFGVQIIPYPKGAHHQIIDLINYLSEFMSKDNS